MIRVAGRLFGWPTTGLSPAATFAAPRALPERDGTGERPSDENGVRGHIVQRVRAGHLRDGPLGRGLLE
jgi:hypothetical protein